MVKRQTVAVIGSGIAGLTAAYILQKKYDVTVYEAEARLGGHTHTHEVTDFDGHMQHVDSGFIVHNIYTYPLLLRLFDELGIETTPTEMSMSVSCRGCGMEYSGGKGYGGIFARPSSLVSPRYIKMMRSVGPFYAAAKQLLAEPGNDDLTLGEFIKQGNYGTYFEQHFILPIVSGVWSCQLGQAKQYPAKYLFAFLENHRMLQTDELKNNTDWRVVKGGSSSYIKKLRPLLHDIRSGQAVTQVAQKGGKIVVSTKDGGQTYDKAVIATHPAQALRLLAAPSKLEAKLLGTFHYVPNTTQLHSDSSILPRRQRAAASWNYYKPSCDDTASSIVFSYDMNRLQHIKSSTHYVVSLNSEQYVDQQKVIATMQYEHPLFTPDSVQAQKRLPELNSSQLAFAGAYHGWGFHEDGCRSGVAAAAALGVDW